MTNVVVMGATGPSGRYIVEALANTDLETTLFVRNEAKLAGLPTQNMNIVVGDATSKADMERAIKGADVVVSALGGDVLPMAKVLEELVPASSVKQIVWMTGMGIHNEITGPRGEELARYAQQMPEYIVAADTVAAIPVDVALLRCPLITEGDHVGYELTEEGVQPNELPIERAALAACIVDLITKPGMKKNGSFGLTNDK